MSEPLLPRYGARSLPEVVPSLLAALGVGGPNPLDVEPARSVCLLLLDGLGAELLGEHAAEAPVLASLAAGSEPLTAGFPATTAASIASLGTGRPPGEHGITGYTFAAPGGVLLNALTWCSHGDGADAVDLRERAVPEQVQPYDTALQRAAGAGLDVRVLAPRVQRGSGLSRAALRGGDFRAVHALGDLAVGVLSALDGRGFCYAYHGDLDLVGHLYGPGSPAWRLQLAHVDHLVASIVQRLPAGALLAVVADHGMVALDDPIDADAEPALREGVRGLAGDVRARHVYADPGAAADVLAAWSELLGDRAWVVSRDEAVAAGWFGPVDRRVAERIGDAVVAARGGFGVLRRVAEPRESKMVGHHGSLTSAEQLVPFLLARREGSA
ncbi:MAG: alkaline phosphatase family protein [Pseudonocardiaceae bacterium]|nr:alkaline phosphatase family protein [Pseudonocardiaceae bacterium]